MADLPLAVLFLEIFGRDPGGAMESVWTDDADTILVASATVATTARRVVERRRAEGQRVGLVTMRLFRPFPGEALRVACRPAQRIGVLDRDYAAGMGGIWAQDVRAAFQGRGDALIQEYLLGIGGGDVTPALVDRVLDELTARNEAGPPVWADLAETWSGTPDAEVSA